MDEQQHWTPADDEVIRGALDTVRRDVDALPLADVRFVKARGVARRRRAMIVGAVWVAAAVTLVGFVGFRALGTNQAFDLRPAVPITTAPNPARPLLAGGPLPISVEWMRALGITESIQLTPGEGEFPDCPIGTPGTQLARAKVGTQVFDANGSWAELRSLDAAQAVYRATSPAAGDTAAATAVNRLVGCRQMKVTAEAAAAWPKVFSGVTANSHTWYVVAHHGALTSLLTDTEPGRTTSRHSLAQMKLLALVAQQRLQEVEGASQPPPSAGVPSDFDEKMPVEGTVPHISSSLFVAASAWSSPRLSAGHATHAVTTGFEGSSELILTCDLTTTAPTLGPDAGRVGVVHVADQITGARIGEQRVRLMGSRAAAAAERQRLVSDIKACREPDIETSELPGHPGFFKSVEFHPGSQPWVGWLAVTVNERTPNAVSVISLDGRTGPLDGFSELSRLVTLAAKK
jgi:hypothetical protein